MEDRLENLQHHVAAFELQLRHVVVDKEIFNATPFKPNYYLELEIFQFISQILDGALCRTSEVQRGFVSPLQVTYLPPVWDLLLPLA